MNVEDDEVDEVDEDDVRWTMKFGNDDGYLVMKVI